MFNCFVVYYAGPVGIFKTEIAAENFIAAMGWGNGATAEGKYIPDLPF